MTATAEQSPTPYQLLPRLTDEEYQALKADIAENGIRVPIDVDENGVVLDGHHRSWIAADLHVECPRRVVTGLTDEQKRAHAIAANVYRRSLTREQRREMVGRLRTLGMSVRQIADVASVPRSTVAADVSESGHVGTETVTGSDGKTYSPKTVVGQRRDTVRQLLDQGYNQVQIAEMLGTPRSTIGDDVRAVTAPPSPGASRGPSPADTPRKIERIRELAAQAWSSPQIARDLGVSEERVRHLARNNSIEITADKVIGKARRIDSTQVAAEIVASVEALALPMRLVNFSEIDPAQAGEWADSLTESIRALNRFAKQMKETAQ